MSMLVRVILAFIDDLSETPVAFNIRDIARLAEFEMDTSAYGRVRIGCLRVSDVSAAEQAHTEQQAEALDIARMLFSRLARPLGAEESAGAGEDPSSVYFEGSAIGAEEVEEFAKEMVKHNSYFAKAADGEEITKNLDESYVDYLLRLILQYRVSERARWEKVMRPVTSSVFGNATRSAWAESELASNRLGATLDALRVQAQLPAPPTIVSPPPLAHPMKGTNERLDRLVNGLEDYRPALVDTAAAIVALERTVREMQANFATNSADADRRMLRAEIVAIVSLLFTAVGLGTSTYFSIKQIDDDSVVKELHAIRAEQQADRKTLINALEKLEKAQRGTDSQGPATQALTKASSAPMRSSASKPPPAG